MTSGLALVTQRVVTDSKTGERRDALDQRWSAFLAQCGLLAVPVPNNPALALDIWDKVRASALVLTGGNDLASAGGDAPERDRTEHMLLDRAFDADTPVVGICRGLQVIGVHLGAELKRVGDHVGSHTVTDGSGLRLVNSYHNFALADLPSELIVTARSGDGGIEAVVGRSIPLLGMMWHPERHDPFDPRDIQAVRSLVEKTACAA